MNYKGKLLGVKIDNKEGKARILIETTEQNRLIREYEKLKGTNDFSVEIRLNGIKRSFRANRYCWKLINEIANVNRANKQDVYLEMLKRYGQSEIISVLSSIDVSNHLKYYEEIGKGTDNGEEYTHYIVYKGSSEYNKREMAILIDGVVSECIELGIPILSPAELKSLKESWCNYD